MVTLRNVLKVNSISSGATGICLVTFSEFFASLFEVSQRVPFVTVGLFLILFAGFVMLVALQKSIRPRRVKKIIAIDAGWVMGSVVAVLWLNGTISIVGMMIILLVAVWVGVMAILQFMGAKAVDKLSDPL